jgi:hypothetical protein
MSLCLSLLGLLYASPCLALPSFASPSRSADAIGLVLHLLWEGYITCFWLSVENHVFGKLGKQLI